ncbi:hypothetical protein BDZ85DRAFT_284600 [Elsinoe ampelina]|uniref:Uncharacterized protein n=1 Tax=Elsinoe ampelina TaxID=302913 RepID=A0A6A6G337_9PEZI|nr:hypothetical protein BDZ85DRAFT_284600 [Elsinoe ampelina]
MQQYPPLQALHLRNPNPRGPRLTISTLLDQHPIPGTSSVQQPQPAPPPFPARPVLSLPTPPSNTRPKPKARPLLFRTAMQRNHVIILVLLVFILGLLVFWAVWCRALDREIVHKTRRRVKRREDVESQGSGGV